MDFIFDFLAEIFGEIIIKSKGKIVLKVILFSLLCWFIITVGALAGISALSSNGLTFAILSWTIPVGFLVLWIIGCLKIIRKK